MIVSMEKPVLLPGDIKMSNASSQHPSVGQAYLAQARQRLAAAHDRIKHCLGQLDDVQVWWRPHESMNSIANLVLHLCGNLRQWIISAIGGAQDVRNRPQEFAARDPIPKDELLRRLAAVMTEADVALSKFDAAHLLDARRIQGFDETALSGVFGCLAHVSGHAQEIVYITRLQLRDAYVFAWEPASPEQGAVPQEVPGSETLAARDAVFEEMPGHPLNADTTTVGPTSSAEPAPAIEPGGRKAQDLPVTDYLLSLEQEFQVEQDEGKLE
jgi:hypothetical protein